MTSFTQASDFRAKLGGDRAILAPGIYDPLSALMAERAGFDAVYLSGASIAYTQLARPDIGLVSFDHVADIIGRIRERIALPIVVDADTGWGNAMNVQRVVRLFETRGATAIQLEDQAFPKRCGHFDGKTLISAAEMAGKIRAACDARASSETLIVGRTDAIAVEGYAAAIDRAELYLEAGADILFVEAPQDIAQMEDICARFQGRAPLLANMVEGGRTPVRDADALGAMGFRLVIAPGALVRVLTFATEAFFADLKADGESRQWRERMFDFDGLNDRIGTREMDALQLRYAADHQVTRR